jgi:NAD(P)-dependent dehydrogenase (short-subunit alcohol dehydrogenase family)
MRRLILITGGSRGIGKACAQRFASNGDQVIILYEKDRGAAKTTLELLEGEGHEMYGCNLANLEDIKNLFEKIRESFGYLDILVNAAGIAEPHPLSMEFDEWMKAWDRTLSVNLRGSAACCYLGSKLMEGRNHPRIINVSSRGAFRGEPEMPGYGASKAGMNSLTQSLAKALGEKGIAVTAVAPGFVETDMAKPFLEGEQGAYLKSESPFKRVARPDEVAGAIFFLAEENSEFLSGGIIDLNGASYLRM